MADFVFVASALYFLSAVAFMVYRIYGVVSRRLTVQFAANALKKYTSEGAASEIKNPVRQAARNILDDQLISSEEFDIFREISISYFISERSAAVEDIQKALKDQDVALRTLLFLTNRSMKNQLAMSKLVESFLRDGKSNILGSLSAFFVQRRFGKYVDEYTRLIEKDFSKLPKRRNFQIEPSLEQSLGLRAAAARRRTTSQTSYT